MVAWRQVEGWMRKWCKGERNIAEKEFKGVQSGL